MQKWVYAIVLAMSVTGWHSFVLCQSEQVQTVSSLQWSQPGKWTQNIPVAQEQRGMALRLVEEARLACNREIDAIKQEGKRDEEVAERFVRAHREYEGVCAQAINLMRDHLVLGRRHAKPQPWRLEAFEHAEDLLAYADRSLNTQDCTPGGITAMHRAADYLSVAAQKDAASAEVVKKQLGLDKKFSHQTRRNPCAFILNHKYPANTTDNGYWSDGKWIAAGIGATVLVVYTLAKYGSAVKDKMLMAFGCKKKKVTTKTQSVLTSTQASASDAVATDNQDEVVEEGRGESAASIA